MIIKQGTTLTTYYVETDHQGSIIGLLNTNGTYAEKYSYDACFVRRSFAKAEGQHLYPTDWSFNNVTLPTLIDRGYTGHAGPPKLKRRREHPDKFWLIIMLSEAKSRQHSVAGNGRMYDPYLGRFLSVDPVIQSTTNSQTFNGYSYCLNNPLKFTDPTGYSTASDAWTNPYSAHTVAQMWLDAFGQNIENPFEQKMLSDGPGGGGKNIFIYVLANEVPKSEWEKLFNELGLAKKSDTNINLLELNGTPWMDIAKGEIGVLEIYGSTNNSKIIEYHATTGSFKDDETPWCSSYVNWVLEQAGLEGTRSAAAKSWLNYGNQLDEFKYGAIAVVKNGNNYHVGFAVDATDSYVRILGGNQGPTGQGSVKYSNFSFSIYNINYVFP